MDYLRKRKGSKYWKYIRPLNTPEEREAFNGSKSVIRTLGEEDKNLAKLNYAAVHYFVEKTLDTARQGRPTGSAFDTLRRERLRNIQTVEEKGFGVLEDEPDLYHLDLESVDTTEIAILVEEYKNEQRILELQKLRDSGKLSTGEANKQIAALQCLLDGTVPEGEEKESSKAPLLSKTIAGYWTELESEATRGQKRTLAKKKTQVAEFIKCCGDKFIDDYDKDDGRRFVEYLRGHERPKCVQTINEYTRSVHNLFDWLKPKYNEEIVSPTKGFHIQKRKKRVADRPRGIFEDADLDVIFQHLKPENPLYWISLCAYFSSCRGGELVGLKKEDIQTEKGIVYFSIYGEHLKNVFSERTVPLHKDLIDLGFMEYVDRLDKGAQVFPSFAYGDRFRETNGSDKWQDRMSVRFSKFLRQIGVKRPEISFHSWRHCFVWGIRNTENIDPVTMYWIQGRTESGSQGEYAKEPKMKKKQAELNKIEFYLPV